MKFEKSMIDQTVPVINIVTTGDSKNNRYVALLLNLRPTSPHDFNINDWCEHEYKLYNLNKKDN